MRCRECEGLLWGYVDGELPDDQRQAVAAHLTACPRCALAHERLRAFPLQAGQVPAIAPPPDFTARLMQRITPLPPPCEIAARAADDPVRRGSFGGAIGALVAFSAAAAAVVLGLLSTSTLALLSGHRPSIATSAQSTGEIANAIGVWMTAEIHQFLTWPVLAALWGMQVVLAVLWFRVVAPRRRATSRYTLRTAEPHRRHH